MALLEITQKFTKVYFDNCALKYQARNLNDDEAIRNQRFIKKYIKHAMEVLEVLNHNGVIIQEVFNEFLKYIHHISQLKGVDEQILNAYNNLITSNYLDNEEIIIHKSAKCYESWLNSNTDKKLFSILKTKSNIALITNDTNLIRACISEDISVSDRIITKVDFHSFYILTSRPLKSKK